MPTKIIGTAPYQVPRNADLGTLAVQDADSINIQGGAVTLGASSTQGYFQNTDVSEVKPSLLLDFANSRSLDTRVSFSRASSASYYDGCTSAKAEQNLLLYSQRISDSTWGTPSYGRWSMNAAIAPDGTLTASKLEETTTTAYAHQFYQSISNLSTGNATCSVYLKAGERTWACIGFGGGNTYASFNLSTGALGTVIGSGTSSITAVGNGWYRCVLIVPANTGGVNFSIWPTTSDSPNVSNFVYAGTIGYGLYVWGAQVENRIGASAYTATTSSQITQYVPQLLTAATNTPRFDHDPITKESKGLLIEESRTNVALYSQQFTVGWNTIGVSCVDNVCIAPDGTLTGGKLVASVYNGNHVLYKTGFPTNTNATISIYAKKSELSRIWLGSYETTHGVEFDIENGKIIQSVGNVVKSEISHVGNGWYRCATTINSAYAQITYGLIQNGTNFYNQTMPSIGLYIWGAQVEVGSFVTSYIPTTSAQVTRATEYAISSGAGFSSWFNNDEGTLYADFTIDVGNSDNTYQSIVSIENTGAMTQALAIEKSRNGYASGVLYGAAYGKSMLSSFAYADRSYKAAVSGSIYSNSSAFVSDGVLHGTNSELVGVWPADKFVIGQDPWGDPIKKIWIKKIAYYPKQLTTAELQEITL